MTTPTHAHTACIAIPADHPAFDGHFPGQPLLPGVVLLAEVMEAALAVPELAALLGAAPRIAAAKFPARRCADHHAERRGHAAAL